MIIPLVINDVRCPRVASISLDAVRCPPGRSRENAAQDSPFGQVLRRERRDVVSGGIKIICIPLFCHNRVMHQGFAHHTPFTAFLSRPSKTARQRGKPQHDYKQCPFHEIRVMIQITNLIFAQESEYGLRVIRHFLCLMNFLAAFAVAIWIHVFPKIFQLRQQLLLASFECAGIVIRQIRM